MKLLSHIRTFVALSALLIFPAKAQSQAPQASINITYPKAGDAVMAGQIYTKVRVTAEGLFYNPVVYEFTTNGGAKWELIKKETYPGKGYISNSFNWDVPNIEAPNVQLRITDSLGSVGLSEIFRIREIPKILTARVNNGRYPLPVDYDVVIEWDASGELSPIDIDYVVDGFAIYQIAFQIDSTLRSYVWRTPPEPRGDIVLRVQAQHGGIAQVGPFEVNFTNAVDAPADAGSRLSVYPNPASSVLNVTCETSAPLAYVTLSDVAGRVVLEREVEVSAGEFDLDVSQILPGNYMLSSRSSEGTSSRMVTISR